MNNNGSFGRAACAAPLRQTAPFLSSPYGERSKSEGSIKKYITLLFFALVSHAYCQAPSSSQEPLAYEMTADEIDCSQETHKCTARRNARVSTGSGEQAKILTAGVVRASIQEDSVGSHVAPQVIEAEGNVLLETQGKTIQSIRADKAHYEPQSQKAVFKGNVLLRFGSHVFKGDEVTAELGQGNFVLRRSAQTPVSGLIYPMSKNRYPT